MHDTLQAARELARHWREAKGDGHLVRPTNWRGGLAWADLDPPPPSPSDPETPTEP